MKPVIAWAIGAVLLVALAVLVLACVRGEAGNAAAPGSGAANPAPAHGEHAAHPDGHGGAPADHATVHHAFDNPEEWAKIFDDPARDEWQKPGQVVQGLAIEPGMTVADLGAGTGYFTAPLSKAVGSKGVVLGIDPEPEMVEYLGRRAHREGLANVVPVLALYEDPFLPPGRVDRVLIVNTYHHIDDRQQYFRRLGANLAPGGSVTIIDFHKRPLPVGPPPEAKLEREVVVAEMQKAGFRLKDEPTFLPYQYFLIFEPTQRGTP